MQQLLGSHDTEKYAMNVDTWTVNDLEPVCVSNMLTVPLADFSLSTIFSCVPSVKLLALPPSARAKVFSWDSSGWVERPSEPLCSLLWVWTVPMEAIRIRRALIEELTCRVHLLSCRRCLTEDFFWGRYKEEKKRGSATAASLRESAERKLEWRPHHRRMEQGWGYTSPRGQGK